MNNPYNGLPIERVGFTGTRYNMSDLHLKAFEWLLERMWPFKEFHHGACLGADAEAHVDVRSVYGNYNRGGPQIHGWPPTNEMRLARNVQSDCDVLHEAREYKARDREIVWHTQVLIACPNSDYEMLRSGTFYTMRQALAIIRPIYFIKPSTGEIVTNWKSEMNPRVMAKETAEALSQADTSEAESGGLDDCFAQTRPTKKSRSYGDLDDAFSK